MATGRPEAGPPTGTRKRILHTITAEGSRNFSQFVNRAVMLAVGRLEQMCN